MKVYKLISGIFQTLLILGFVFIAFITFSSKIPFLSRLGFNFYYVISGSMEPTIPTGSLIYSAKFRLEDLKKNDVITYYLRDDKSGAVSIVTHRISEVRKEERIQSIKNNDGQENQKKILSYEFVTKGDANAAADLRTTPASNILGKYQWHVPYLGFISSFVQTPKGFVTIIILPAVILIVWEIIDLIRYFKSKYEHKSNSEIEKLRKQLAEKEAESHMKKSKKKLKKA